MSIFNREKSKVTLPGAEKKNGEKSKVTLTKAEQRKRKDLYRKVLRLSIQILFFFLMPGAFVAGFSGIKYLFSCLSQGNVIEINGFVKSLLGLAAFTLVFGRFFCGYVCAFGTTGDVLHGISTFVQLKLLKRTKVFRLPDGWTVHLQKLKYMNLISIVVMCTFGVYTRLSGSSIWDVFSRLARGQGIPAGYSLATVLLIITAGGMLLEERFFCQFLCPMGAVFALLPVFPFSMLRRQESRCGKNCRLCQSRCPAHLKLAADGRRSGECIACEKCRIVCPNGNISASLDGIFRREWIGVLIKTLVFLLLGYSLGF